MILLDFSSVAMSSIMVQIKTFEEKPEMVRHTIFNIIRKYNVMFRAEYGEMVVCIDSKKNWRKESFPEYKAARRKNRKNDDKDWKAIFELFGAVKEELHTYSPFKVIEADWCEADDVIGVLAANSDPSEPTVIVSPDKDFVQLQRFPNIAQYSNLQKKWVKPDVNALFDLEEKILRGDSGDGIPNVLSENDSLINEEKRQTPMSKKKMESLKSDPEALGVTIARNIIRNKDLIDLSRTPEEYKANILEEFQKPAKGSINRLMTLFTKNRMRMMIECLGDFEINTLK